MAKPPTDLIIWIDHFRDPFREVVHINLKARAKQPKDQQTQSIKFNDHFYPLRIKYAAPTKYYPMPKDLKWIKRKPTIRFLQEHLRAKRVSVLRFKEPCDMKCSKCPQKTTAEPCPPSLVMPIHISRFVSPTGELRPIEEVEGNA